jgi:hypothetical protein
MLTSRFGHASRLASQAIRSNASRSMASLADNKVEMAPLETGKGHYINYQRIEDNLKVVRER